LERFAKIMKVSDTIFNLSRYLLELSLINYNMIKFRNSNLAASAIYLALKMTKSSSPWNETISKHSSYREQEVR
jgi:G2/mitotic-specific cyclin-B, other